MNQENINSNRAVLYVRPFSGEEATKARAIQYQRAQLEEFCRQRGWKVVGEYVDKLGAVPGRRPGFNKMLKDVQNGKLWFDRLVVHSVSRFGRNMAEVDFAIQSLRQRGIQLVSTTGEISDHEMDLLFGRFTVLFDEYSSQQASEQVRRAMRKNAQLGFYCGGATPYGFRTYVASYQGSSAKKKLELDPLEAEVIRKMFALLEKGDSRSGPMDVKSIAAWLNEHGHQTRSGKNWTGNLVRKILTNKAVSGDFFYGKNAGMEAAVHVSIPQIIPVRRFYMAQKTLRKGNPKTTPSTSHKPKKT